MGVIWKGLGVLAALIAVGIAVILLRTAAYGNGGGSGDSAAMMLPEPPPVDADLAAAHLSEAVAFRTITLAPGDPRPGREGPWLALHDWLQETYPLGHAAMTREVVPGTLTLLYSWEGSDPSLAPLMLMAHQDVVPVNIGTESDWTGAPFAGDRVDGHVFGRGTLDDKGSLVALMEAAESLAAAGFEPRRTLIFMFGHDEEVSGSGAEAAVDLLHGRGVRPAMVLDEGFFVVDPNPLSGKPMGFIGVAEKGYTTLQLTALAEGGHSSRPPRDSAAVRLARAIVALEENQMPSHLDSPTVAPLFERSAPDMPFLQRMAFANLWLFRPLVEQGIGAAPSANAMVRTTTAPTMLAGSIKENVLPQRAVATVNFRIHPEDTAEDVLAHVSGLVEPFGVAAAPQARGGIGAGASPVSPMDSTPYRVLEAIAREAGEGAPVAPGLVLGATDSRFAGKISGSVYRFVPALVNETDLAGFHGTNERLSVENMGRMVRGYAQLILAMDAGDGDET